ncbi:MULTISPECIES: hypothetical protein [Corynebacterium]|uniref:Uncharacterized protein n=1 Tax=Corynebacterium lowii TaxID=1544413 RepID=A0A0Q0YU96_9CORY|nr:MULTISPECIES: hypothetical protein [Corynebacterium]KQB85933.1 hypothetical protein Clow_01675 [Corynebacterium lowii]MDK8451151.1 hypothetical protein [Corynebacterium mastitidis]MDP9850639.1 hypothetical protein [Corynebacterium lowii]
MRAQRFLATAGAATLLSTGLIAPAHAEDGAEGSGASSEGSSLPVDTREYDKLDVTPEQREELVKRKQQLSTEQAEVTFDVAKSITQIALFFSGVGIPVMPLLSSL